MFHRLPFRYVEAETTANNATGRDGRDLRAFLVVHRWLCPHIFVLVSLHGNIELTRTAKLKTLRNTVRSITFFVSALFEIVIHSFSGFRCDHPPLAALDQAEKFDPRIRAERRNGRTRSARRRWRSWVGGYPNNGVCRIADLAGKTGSCEARRVGRKGRRRKRQQQSNWSEISHEMSEWLCKECVEQGEAT